MESLHRQGRGASQLQGLFYKKLIRSNYSRIRTSQASPNRHSWRPRSAMPVRPGEVPILSPPAGLELPDFATPTSVNETWCVFLFLMLCFVALRLKSSCSGQGRALGQSRSDQNQGGASTHTYSPLSVGHLFSNFGNFKYLGMDHDGLQPHHLTEWQARKQTPDSPSTRPVTCHDMMQPGPMLPQPVASASSQLHFPQPNGAAPWEIRSDLSAQVNTEWRLSDLVDGV